MFDRDYLNDREVRTLAEEAQNSYSTVGPSQRLSSNCGSGDRQRSDIRRSQEFTRRPIVRLGPCARRFGAADF